CHIFSNSDSATSVIYTLSLHDALPIFIQNDILLGAANDRRYVRRDHVFALAHTDNQRAGTARRDDLLRIIHGDHAQRILTAHTRSEEHTSELQSRFDLVCRLLLEKKKH